MKNLFVKYMAAFLFFFTGIAGCFSASDFTDSHVGESESAPRIKVACIGDSITAGFGLKKGYPAYLQEILGERYEVRNFGNSGRGVILDTVRHGREFRAYMLQKEHAEALAFAPDIVICNLGINDDVVVLQGAEKEAAFIRDYGTLLRAYAALPSAPRIFIWSDLLPIGPSHRHYQSCTAFAPFRIGALLKTAADENRVTGLNLFDPLFGNPRVLAKDGLHPSDYGARQIARTTAEQLAYYLNVPDSRLDLHYFIGSNMVLQHDAVFTCSGFAPPHACVRGYFDTDSPTQTQTDAYGRFTLRFLPKKTNQMYTFTVETDSALRRFEHVAFGECFVALGQSNLAFRVNQSEPISLAADSALNARISMLMRNQTYPFSGVWDIKKCPPNIAPDHYFHGTWQTAEAPSERADFSAVAYAFALYRTQKTRMPTGIIVLSVGGIPMESFLPRDILSAPEATDLHAFLSLQADTPVQAQTPWIQRRIRRNLSAFFDADPADRGALPFHYDRPGALYAGALAPLKNLPIAGLIYYQGESNAETRPDADGLSDTRYNPALFDALVPMLRRHFSAPALPMAWVMLPESNRPWGTYRKVQMDAAQRHGFYLCNILDAGDFNDVHPRDKETVGRRLNICFETKNTTAKCPPIQVKTDVPNQIQLVFPPEITLQVLRKPTVKVFDILDDKGHYVPVNAVTVEPHRVILKTDLKPENRQAVRYAFISRESGYLAVGPDSPLFPFEISIR